MFCPKCGDKLDDAFGGKCARCGNAPSETAKPDDRPWYRKPGGITLLLILFWPVGLPLMWISKVYSPSVRIVVTTVFGALTLFAAMSPQSSRQDHEKPFAVTLQNQPDTKTVEAEQREQAIQVTAMQLWDAYQANEVRADEHFKDRQLLVAGVLASIDKDFAGDVVLKLATPNQFMHVQAELQDGQRAAAARLDQGHNITLLCRGSGMVMRMPMLNKCIIK